MYALVKTNMSIKHSDKLHNRIWDTDTGGSQYYSNPNRGGSTLSGLARRKPVRTSYVTNTTMLTGNARRQLMPKLLKKTPAPSTRTVSVMQWKKPLYRFVSLAPSICRRALITSMGVPRVQPAIPAIPPASITPLQSGRNEKTLMLNGYFYIFNSSC